MSLAKGTVLLLLLAAISCDAAPAAEECAPVTQRLPTADLHQIFGHWVLVWSVSGRELGQALLGKLASSHVEFKLDNDNKTIDYIERNQFVEHGKHDSCTSYFIKMTMPSDDAEHHTIKCDSIQVEKDGAPVVYNDTGVVDFYKTCSDCLLMTYTTQTHKYLLFYKKEGSHPDVEQHKAHHDDHRKVAECLGFPHNQPFIYNGKADFCHKSSILISEECRPAVTPLSLADPSVIFGDWVLVWSVSDHDEGHDLLSKVSSSHVEFKGLPNDHAVQLTERNVYIGSLHSCTTYFVNMTKVSGDADQNTLRSVSIRVEKDGAPVVYNDTGVVDFYKTCSDCLLMTYKTQTHKYLLFYKKEGSHPDVEQHKTHHDDHKKVAECLGFPHNQPYIYNGKADFCHKKSAPATNPQQA
ncbi:saxitoxin and tetrodotoxin-binding protein 1 [Austrofundulus limnaeus]|uniref:Saxitoxin and tetrodotoxin-binding protein 1 n=1 Tax=Austrofundulus limnaeus TaxID=52670 RepID=A0A2I4CKZ2_AUSLI|nr:PREDICTED: saxitoxin and tetrodotoxin-binding protein 1-like [Austrofundulus limnaeus]